MSEIVQEPGEIIPDEVPTPDGAPYVCQECGQTFDNPNVYGGHISSAHKTRVPCPDCGRMFTPGPGLSHHITVAHKRPSGAVPFSKQRRDCPECGANIRAKDMNRHRRDVHGAKIPGRPPGSKSSVKLTTRSEAPLVAEQIVRAACSLIWPDGIPPEKLEPVLRWHAQTASFLLEVQPAGAEVSHPS